MSVNEAKPLGAVSGYRQRCGQALWALAAGCGAGVALTWVVSLLPFPSGSLRTVLAFDAFVALFASLGWLVTVLPLALSGKRPGLLSNPIAAPVFGAICGVLLLQAELWLFFGKSPAAFFQDASTWWAEYFSGIAALTGGTISGVYVRLSRVPRGSPGGGGSMPSDLPGG